MTSPPTAPPGSNGRPLGQDRANASVIPTVAGVPFWGAIGIAAVLTAIGCAVDGAASGALGWGFRIGFLGGIALAAFAVRRRSIFTAMVQAPLVMVVVVMIAEHFMQTERLTLTMIKVVDTFPTMAIGTAVGLVLGLIRIIAEPLRSRSGAARRERAHA